MLEDLLVRLQKICLSMDAQREGVQLYSTISAILLDGPLHQRIGEAILLCDLEVP